MSLIEHARRELELCGQYEEDPAFAVSVLAAVSAFAAYPGHSGGSAAVGINMLNELLQFKNLSPLTNDPEEWIKHTPEMWDGEHHVWQNVRNSSAFSIDGGITYTLVDEDRRSQPYRTLITHDNSGQPLAPVKPPANEEAQTANYADEPVQQDAITGVKCACGEIIRTERFAKHCEDNGPAEHYEEGF